MIAIVAIEEARNENDRTIVVYRAPQKQENALCLTIQLSLAQVNTANVFSRLTRIGDGFGTPPIAAPEKCVARGRSTGGIYWHLSH
jgi:hypothetical protein